ncbi:MAG: hypothetical protein ABSG95_01030 [Solirubrobacteraceae bacterium]
MPDASSFRHPASAPALAGQTLDALLARAEELARQWAVALILTRSLEQIAAIPLEGLALEGPALCAQVVAALASEAELERLTGGAGGGEKAGAPARRLLALAAARDGRSAVEAVEALRSVVWDAVLEELRSSSTERPSGREVGDLADRLAYVCAMTLAAGLAAVAEDELPARYSELGDGAAGAVPGAHDRARSQSEARGAVLVDECAEVDAPPAWSLTVEPPALSGEGPGRVPAPSWEQPAWASSLSAQVISEQEIKIRDERGGEGPAAWIGSIGLQLERFERDRRPFAVLLVELEDLERLSRVEPAREISRLARQVEDVLAAELRGGASPAPERAGALQDRVREPIVATPGFATVVRERPGRYWVLAPETDERGAGVLAARLAGAVGACASPAGRRREVVVGTAVCPEHGEQAAALAAHADVALYAARAAARAGTAAAVERLG